MKTRRLIYKWKMENGTAGRVFSLHLPVHTRIIKFDFQDGIPVVWGIFREEDLGTEEHRIVVLRFTGTAFASEEGEDHYVGTATNPKNMLVYHCFVKSAIGMRATYDGTWVAFPVYGTYPRLFVEWLCQNGHTVGAMTVHQESEEDLKHHRFKVYFEFSRPALMKELIKYLNDNQPL